MRHLQTKNAPFGVVGNRRGEKVLEYSLDQLRRAGDDFARDERSAELVELQDRAMRSVGQSRAESSLLVAI